MHRAVCLATIHRHRLFQECLRSALDRDGRYRLVEVDCGGDAIGSLREASADVVIIDAGLPEDRGLALMRAIRQELPAVRVLAIASGQSGRRVIASIESGAHGCLLDESSIDDLTAAIEVVLRGQSYCTQRGTDLIFSQLAAIAEEAHGRPQIDTGRLTTREREILELIAEGWSNKQIAQELHLSVYTVKNHVHKILEKLPAGSRHEAAHLARGSVASWGSARPLTAAAAAERSCHAGR